MSFKDISMLKESIAYEKETGNFYRLLGYKKHKKSALFCKNYHATIKIARQNYVKYHNAWRVAVYFSHGYYPAFEDAVVFIDGNKENFRIDNILVIHPSEDECTVLDFSSEHNLSVQTVNHRMINEVRILRTIKNNAVYFYKKDDFMRKCGDLINKRKKLNDDNDDDVYIKKQVVLDDTTRKNKTIRLFLATHFLTPSKWEMTLS